MSRRDTTPDQHAAARDRKRKKRDQMVVSNRSIFTILTVIGKKAKQKPKKRP
jgi:hypothetical protein